MLGCFYAESLYLANVLSQDILQLEPLQLGHSVARKLLSWEVFEVYITKQP